MSSRLGGTPEVHAHGWPFLAVLATHRLGGVDVTMPSATVRLEGRQAHVDQLVVHGSRISGATDVDRARVGSLDGSAHLGWQELSTALGQQVTSAGGNRVLVRRHVEVAGLSVQAEASGVPQVVGGRLHLAQPRVTAGGLTLSGDAAQQVADSATSQVVLPSRAGVTVTSLSAVPDGVTVGLHGDDVELSRLR